MRWIAALPLLLFLSGCIVLQPRAENPYPNMNTIAVAPFLNLSPVPSEINDLGRTFGLAYSTELQKIQGYDVMPMGVVETAIIEYNIAAKLNGAPELNLGNPADVLRLAKLLQVDAIVIGAISTYNPYYPPEIGMKVDWYSNKNWTITADEEPCGPCDDAYIDENGNCSCDFDLPKLRTKDNNSIIRGQNAVPLFEHEAEPLLGFEPLPPRITSNGSSTANQPVSAHTPAATAVTHATGARGWAAPRPVTANQATEPVTIMPVQLLHPETPVPLGDRLDVEIHESPQTINLANQAPLQVIPGVVHAEARQTPPPMPAPQIDVRRQQQILIEEESSLTIQSPAPQLKPIPLDPALLDQPGTIVEFERDHTKPVMSYTKIFDGKSEEIVSLLRDYVEIQGDKRSGGWEGYMQRTDDYIKFCCHVMIVDMLSLHGGALKTKVWLKPRKNP